MNVPTCSECGALKIGGACKCPKPSEFQPPAMELYLVIEADNLQELRMKVNSRIAQGYIVIGPAVLTYPEKNKQHWHQTLVHKSISAQVYA